MTAEIAATKDGKGDGAAVYHRGSAPSTLADPTKWPAGGLNIVTGS
jgi:hypothetical protein